MKQKIINIICGLAVVFILWIALSTVEVIAKNHSPEPQYTSINFYQIIK